jgi:hypothetical protein
MRNRDSYQLARLASCADPESATSEGALFLTRVEGAVAEAIDYCSAEGSDVEEAIREAVDSSVPISTHRLWRTFVDLCAYQEEADGGRAPRWRPDPSRRLAYALVEEASDGAVVSAPTRTTASGHEVAVHRMVNVKTYGPSESQWPPLADLVAEEFPGFSWEHLSDDARCWPASLSGRRPRLTRRTTLAATT